MQSSDLETKLTHLRVGVLLPALGLLGATLSAPRTACASSGNSFLETIGISIAVGTVLGASTLPFYDQPGKHLINAAYGASAGAVVGIGILAYHLIAGPSQDGFDDYSSQPRDEKPRAFVSASSVSSLRSGAVPSESTSLAWNSRAAAQPTQIWMPVVSLSW